MGLEHAYVHILSGSSQTNRINERRNLSVNQVLKMRVIWFVFPMLIEPIRAPESIEIKLSEIGFAFLYQLPSVRRRSMTFSSGVKRAWMKTLDQRRPCLPAMLLMHKSTNFVFIRTVFRRMFVHVRHGIVFYPFPFPVNILISNFFSIRLRTIAFVLITGVSNFSLQNKIPLAEFQTVYGQWKIFWITELGNFIVCHNLNSIISKNDNQIKLRNSQDRYDNYAQLKAGIFFTVVSTY